MRAAPSRRYLLVRMATDEWTYSPAMGGLKQQRGPIRRHLRVLKRRQIEIDWRAW
jgi:hypothetical protein